MNINYHCSKCGKEILRVGEAWGRMERCPHCGVYLKGLSEHHIGCLTVQFILVLGLTVFFVLAAVAAPPAILVGIMTGIGAVILYRKRRSAITGKVPEQTLAKRIASTNVTLQRQPPRQQVRFCTQCGARAAGRFCGTCGKPLLFKTDL